MSNDPNNPLVRGLCPAPFLDMAQYPNVGGNVQGRMCSDVGGGLTCCLPCPATDWIYPQSFNMWYRISQIISAVGMAISMFLLISWAVLPAEKSRRHYLSVCLVIGILLECLAFVIPLGSKPNQCYNAITPHDMRSDIACAFSGASVVLGGLVTTIWICFRSLSMHLQICWDIVPDKKFFFTSLGVGWGFALLFSILTLALTGVSYRFGDTCHVNSTRSMGEFWIPLLVIAGITALLQFGTLLYCFKVYLANAWTESNAPPTQNSDLPSYSSSHRTHQARIMYQRLKKVLWLQWRSMTIVVFLLVDIVFFAVVWIQLDYSVNDISQHKTTTIVPFLACILVNPSIDARSKCFELGQRALVGEKTSIAVLLLLSLTGIQTGLLMIRSSLLSAWVDFFRSRFSRKREFVSLDAKRFSNDPRTIQMMEMHNTPNRVASANTALSGTDTISSKEPGEGSPYFAQSHFERNYKQPRMSFSTPRPLSSHATRGWDGNDTQSIGKSSLAKNSIDHHENRI
ncbi:hypothetical protein BT63DRAFT_5292 [Microthyrium microscopicum]|uniref:G-protein coupled receptors family 2 profile 2 domain-containing protein n=1 Tax=Microthyrium microscopicum TaxID=703497 RepID=A0A6A6URY8_9PEZI|nr:hypothetical protein BT63DRAFT_5292 [Microthyrium microscopicum]